MMWDCTLGDTPWSTMVFRIILCSFASFYALWSFTSFYALSHHFMQGLSHHFMLQALSQTEEEGGENVTRMRLYICI